jgi:hypothetical protein
MAAVEDAGQVNGLAGLLALAEACLDGTPGFTLAELADEIDPIEIGAAVRECLDLGSLPAAAGVGRPKTQRKPDWMLLWSHAQHELRLTADEFWSLTPRQFAALNDRHAEAYRRALEGAAMITATLLNINRDPQKHPTPIQPADLLPGPKLVPRRAPADVDPVVQSRRIFGALGERTVIVQKTKPVLKRQGNT